ncbi:diaminopimelate decarboxylase [Sutterella sp.]|uniref:diaminopimelate decarboxylase n=1 Tax=Sutterella sp. TaxID=1981025 RepID=UPI0026DFFE69|nr:diaminopimelate decarboxylase [Sutterella sp.]MDO5531270.1 diaminopimelate decarboxylase [Sutterella sp.]
MHSDASNINRPDSLSTGIGFHRSPEGELLCEDVRLTDLAREFGTPLYVYSRAAVAERFRAYEAAFGDTPHQVCYAVKASSTKGVLELLASLGAGFDCVSGGEILRALEAGGDPKKIVYSGVAKGETDIAFALNAGIRCFNIESPAELDRINAIAETLGHVAHVSVRVNPNIDAHVDAHVATGLGDSKFGVKLTDVVALYEKAAKLPAIEIEGISCHIGSMVESTEPFMKAVDVLAGFVNELARRGIVLSHIDLGGGAGVKYHPDDKLLEPAELIPALVARVAEKVDVKGIEIFVEPGRSLIAQSAVLLTTVEYLKSGLFLRRFCIVDASMTELVRPAMYGSYHSIEPVIPNTKAQRQVLNIVGGVCESTDFLGNDRDLAVEAGDLLAIRTAGAYGASMASTYNSRPLPMEVMVDGANVLPMRRPQTALDLTRDELPLGLAGDTSAAAEGARALFGEALEFARSRR